MGLTLVKTHNFDTRKQYRQYRLLRDFKFIKPLRIVDLKGFKRMSP